MKTSTSSSQGEKLSLKEPTGWFAAGNGFRKASSELSDGAFKLFVYICMEANRQTGRFQATHQELATALGKSKRTVGTHVRELQDKGFCTVAAASNQHDRTVFEISDSYWPYTRSGSCPPSNEKKYVEAIRERFLSLGCTSGIFSAADEQIAQHLYRRAIPLAVIENAMLLGACRKYISWLNHQAPDPIASLRYFESVIAEIQTQSWPAGYLAYVRRKFQELAEAARVRQMQRDVAPSALGPSPQTNFAYRPDIGGRK